MLWIVGSTLVDCWFICEGELADDVSWRCFGLIVGSLALDPTFGIHSHKTLDTAQPCHLLKPNFKTFIFSQYFHPN